MEIMRTRDWLDDGGTRPRLRKGVREGRLESPRAGMVMQLEGIADHERHYRRVLATVPFLGPETYISHTSAAVVHGLPLLARRHGEVVAIRTGGGHGNVNRTLHARRPALQPGDVTFVDGIPLTGLARTVADLVRTLPFLEAVMVADAALARGLDRTELLAATATGRGCRMAARALNFADPLAESAGESISRVRMLQAALPTPVLQQVFYSRHGVLLGRGDFWWERFRLIGEFDGRSKYGGLLRPGETAADVVMAEKRRHEALRAAGYGVVRWIWGDLWKPGFGDRIRREMVVR